MTQTKSGMINTTLSMMIVDAFGMPPNLGRTGGEDYPESSFRVVAYDGKNVIPTALGYKSYFSDNTKFNIPPVPSEYIQAVLVYQTQDYSNILIALCEEGAYFINATEGESWSSWTQHIVTGYNPADQVRHLWTWAVVANQLYLYCQGLDKFYCVCTTSYHDNNAGQTIIPDAVVASTVRYSNFGILNIDPSFLNMSGQLGIFRADTRLGFWDSENSVAWSSSTQVYDFTPSVETFAGITKFADVTGNISKILGQDSGFIIYASRSIVRCTQNGSSEMWSGNALMSDNGVAFDTQVNAAQPDTIHYAITGGGLIKIEGASVTFIEPEVSDYLAKQAILSGLDVIDSRYLFLHSTSDFTPSKFEANQEKLEDLDGNTYIFKPTVSGPYTDVPNMLIHVLDGSDAGIQADFEYSAEPTIPATVTPNGLATIPCYSGKEYSTNMDNTITNKPKEEFYAYVYSQIDHTKRYEVKFSRYRPLFDNYYYEVDHAFIDKAAEEFAVNVLGSNMDKIAETIETIKNAGEVFLNIDTEEIMDHDIEATTTLASGTVVDSTVDMSSDFDWTWNNLLTNQTVDVEKSSCGLYLKGTAQNLEYTSTVQIRERVTDLYVIDTVLTANTISVAYTNWNAGTPVVQSVTVNIEYFRVFRLTDSARGFIPTTPDAVTFLNARYDASFTLNQFTQYNNGTNNGFKIRKYTGTIFTGGSNVQAVDSTASDPNGYWQEILYLGIARQFGLPSPGASANVHNHFDGTGNFCGTPNPPMIGGYPVVGDFYKGDRTWSIAIVDSGTQYQESVFSPTINPSTSACDPALLVLYTQDSYGGNFRAYDANLGNRLPTDADRAKLPKIINLLSIDITMDGNYVDSGDEPSIFESEISGYGYQPSGGFSFRKTHSRSSSSPCNPLPTQVFAENPADADYGDSVQLDTNIEIITPKPPTHFPYPDPIPLPDTFALFKKGTSTPFYPDWKGAILYDLVLQKWGRYSNEHKVVYGLLPTNRVDSTIVPSTDWGIRGGAVKSDKVLTYFTPNTDKGMIVYGKIGRNRLGVTEGTKAIAQFAEPATGYLIVELSRDDKIVDETATIAVPLEGQSNVEINFTERAKWFNIRLEGQFDLTYLELQSAPAGRR